MHDAGYTDAEAAEIQAEVTHYDNVRKEVMWASGDYIDLKLYEPAMRHLIDSYIQAKDSRIVSTLDDMTLIQLIVEQGVSIVDAFPDGIRNDPRAIGEAIANNVRRLIINRTPINPKYYEEMSALLDALIEERRVGAKEYKEFLEEIIELAKRAKKPEGNYPAQINTQGKRALYDNLNREEELALQLDAAIRDNKEHGWIGHPIKEKKLRNALRKVLGDESLLKATLEIVKHQDEYQ